MNAFSFTNKTSEQKSLADVFPISVTQNGEPAEAEVKVELPAAKESQVLMTVDKDGNKEIVKKSVVEGDKVYAVIPAGSTVIAVENTQEYEDVPDDAWYCGAIDFVSSHEIFQGTGDKEFSPDAPMTMAMAATVLYRLEDAVAPAGAEGGTWYENGYAWATAEGFVQAGDESEDISREDLVTMIYLYAESIGLDTSVTGSLEGYTDAGKVSGEASRAMLWAVQNGIIRGRDDGTLDPDGPANRAEVAVMVERVVNLIVK